MIHYIKTYSIRYKVKKVYERKILHSLFLGARKILHLRIILLKKKE